MEISYKSDYRHNYLTVRCDEIMKDNYKFRMLTRNDIHGLLSVSERMINGEGYLYYDVTSRQKISVFHENKLMKAEDIKRLISEIENTLEVLNKFMLPEEGLVLDPEYIFMDMDSKNYFFRYSPFENFADSKQLLSEFLIEKVDNEDMEAVETVYRIAEAVNDMSFRWKDIIDRFSSPMEEEIIEKDSFSSSSEPDCGNKPEKTKKKSLWTKFLEWLRQDEENQVFSEPKVESEKNIEDRVSDATVYISRVSCSEHKLYGLGRNNKYCIDLSKAPITVGKIAENVDFLINDSSVSRIHARFVKSGSSFRLQDLNSTNGSYKNGVRLSPNETVTIEPGDEVGLGQLKFIYR